VIPHVVAVCTGTAELLDLGNRSVTTAIDKRPATGPVEVGMLGLAGDTVADQQHHGGLDQALYAYGQNDADFWAETLVRHVPPGAFGENLRLAGIDVSHALIGERWAIGGTVVVEVTAPRIPCRVFATFWEVPDLLSRFLAAGRPGAYLRIIEPGVVAAGDRVRIVARPDHDLTVAEVSRIHTVARHEAARLLEVSGVGERARAWAQEHLGVVSMVSRMPAAPPRGRWSAPASPPR
jgi:MOSC domain-containing protein YiiM